MRSVVRALAGREREVWLVRHAASVLSGTGRWQGWQDVELSEYGIAQCRSLKSSGVLPVASRVIASSLKRCLQTAEILYPNALIRTDSSLRTRDLGEWTGLTTSAIAALGGSWFSPFAPEAPPGGESLETLRARIMQLLEEIGQHSHGTQVVITHGAVIGVILSEAGLEPYIVPHCSHCVILLTQRRIEVRDHPGRAVLPV